FGPVAPVDGAALACADAEALRAELWGVLRHERLCVRGAESAFPGPAPALATALRIPKLVLGDPGGGLLACQLRRLSFVDAQVLGVGFGATICDRHLAGVAGLLTAPYAAERAGEIVGLYTITRFKGEGIGERLVTRLLAEAVERRLAYVFACAVDERAVQFFLRLGFEQLGAERVPVAQWAGYD